MERREVTCMLLAVSVCHEVMGGLEGEWVGQPGRVGLRRRRRKKKRERRYKRNKTNHAQFIHLYPVNGRRKKKFPFIVRTTLYNSDGILDRSWGNYTELTLCTAA